MQIYICNERVQHHQAWLAVIEIETHRRWLFPQPVLAIIFFSLSKNKKNSEIAKIATD